MLLFGDAVFVFVSESKHTLSSVSLTVLSAFASASTDPQHILVCECVSVSVSVRVCVSSVCACLSVYICAACARVFASASASASADARSSSPPFLSASVRANKRASFCIFAALLRLFPSVCLRFRLACCLPELRPLFAHTGIVREMMGAPLRHTRSFRVGNTMAVVTGSGVCVCVCVW